MASTSRRRVVEVEADDMDDLANVEFETSDSVTVIKSFDSMGLKEDLIRGIYAYGKWTDSHFSSVSDLSRVFYVNESYFRSVWCFLVSGFEKPSAIQQRAIKPIVSGRDVIAQAQSGTGKTATFSIGILQTIDTTLRETQCLILSPTRELAVQIQKVRYDLNLLWM